MIMGQVEEKDRYLMAVFFFLQELQPVILIVAVCIDGLIDGLRTWRNNIALLNRRTYGLDSTRVKVYPFSELSDILCLRAHRSYHAINIRTAIERTYLWRIDSDYFS